MMTSSLVCAVDYAYDTRSWASIGMVEEGRRVKASCRSMGGARGVRRGCAREWSEVMDRPPVTHKLDHVAVDAAAQNDHSPAECRECLAGWIPARAREVAEEQRKVVMAPKVTVVLPEGRHGR